MRQIRYSTVSDGWQGTDGRPIHSFIHLCACMQIPGISLFKPDFAKLTWKVIHRKTVVFHRTRKEHVQV